MRYSRVVIILFSTGLYNSVFSTYSFGKTRFSFFCVLLFRVSIFWLLVFTAFACNAKSFANAILFSRLRVTQNALQLRFFFFFFFSFSSVLLARLPKVFLGMFYPGSVCLRSVLLHWTHPKKYFHKNYSLTCYSRCVWHMTYHVLYRK